MPFSDDIISLVDREGSEMVSPGIEFVCPICKKHTLVLKPQDLPSRPFCSSRCKMLDLYRWLNEEIVLSEPIPGNNAAVSAEPEGILPEEFDNSAQSD